MDLIHVLGDTYAAVGSTALLPIYKLNERDIVLMDTGYAKLDRSGLTNLLDTNGLVPKYVLCSHAHFDHTGNVRYLQQRYGAKAIISLIEAGISVNPDSYRANYVALTYGKVQELFLEECFTADQVLRESDTSLTLDGRIFGILPLPGHTAGQLGFTTPDGVAYIGDAILDQSQIDGAKLPTSMFIARDLESKAFLKTTDFKAYILAHKSVVQPEALGALIDHNIAVIQSKRAELLALLEDGMTFPEWIGAFCRQENVRTHNEMKFSIVERNFSNFVSWLTDSGAVTVQREFCAKRYYKA